MRTENNQHNDEQTHIVRFNEVRDIYSSKRIDGPAEQRLNEIIKEFAGFNNNKAKEGVFYTTQRLAILHRNRADATNDLQEKIEYLETAHAIINDLVPQVRKQHMLQPSLLKHQILIKTDLAEALHLTGDHYNAHLIEKSTGLVASELKELFPDYGEGFFTAANASYKRLKWMMGKMLFDLRKTESLLKKPVHTKHRTSQEEVQQYLQDIDRMRSNLTTIYQTIKA
jgi:hypothetical protein